MRDGGFRQTDEEIVSLIQSGKVELFSILIDRYEEKIKRYARKFLADREDIDDVLQDIFIKAYKNIQSFDVKRKFSSWIYRIAHNKLIDALRERNKNPLLFFDFDTFFPYYTGSKNDLSQDIDRKQEKEIIDSCLDKLEPKYKEPIIFYYFEGLSYQEISDILQIPISTVGIRIKRAKDKMRLIYQDFNLWKIKKNKKKNSP